MSIWLKILGPIVLAALLTWGVADWRHLKANDTAAKACVAAVADLKDLQPCPTAILTAVTAARAAASCDAGLSKGEGYAVLKSCSAAVKKRDAEAVTATLDVIDLKEQLRGAEARQSAAVDRATARATTTNQRKADARSAIVRAPAGSDGLAVCDAGCLRALNGN